MTDIYTAPTNGHKITRTSDGGLRINMPGRDYVAGHEPQTLLGGRVESLREFFRDERDRELGQWRWPENPDYVVTPRTQKIKDRRVVRVFRESTGNVNDIREVKPIRRSDDSLNAAHAYFDAHPEKKPWHDAEQNDVWALQIKNCYPPELYRFAQDTTCADSKVFRPVNDPARVFFEANSPLIASAEKVWPQSKES